MDSVGDKWEKPNAVDIPGQQTESEKICEAIDFI
jgi:hypothetical protein